MFLHLRYGIIFRATSLPTFHAPAIGKQVSRVSLRDNTTLFLFTFRSEFVKQRPRDTEEEKSIIRSVFADMGWEVPGILERLDDVTDLYFDHISQIQMASWSMGRVALVGDAAACVSLLAGEGTGLAILEAYVLAGELYVAKGDYVIAFRNYEKRLRNLLIQKQKIRRENVELLCAKKQNADRVSQNCFTNRFHSIFIKIIFQTNHSGRHRSS